MLYGGGNFSRSGFRLLFGFVYFIVFLLCLKELIQGKQFRYRG